MGNLHTHAPSQMLAFNFEQVRILMVLFLLSLKDDIPAFQKLFEMWTRQTKAFTSYEHLMFVCMVVLTCRVESFDITVCKW